MMNNYNLRDSKYENSRRYADPTSDTFKVLVTTVDNNETIDDMQKEGRSAWMGPDADRRNLGITGIRIDQGTLLLDISVPQSVAGKVEMPQVGDIVHCKMNASGRASVIETSHTEYNPRRFSVDGHSVVPMWLSMPGDQGQLFSHKDHGMQFSARPDKHDVNYLPKNKASFITQWVRSVTGFRWRKTIYEDRTVKAGKFVLRGDNVFDIDPEHMPKLIVEETGISLMPVKAKQHQYPQPNNTPFIREERPEFKYRYRVHKWLKQVPKFDPFDEGKTAAIEGDDYVDYTLRTKYQFSYEPILDSKYRTKTSGQGKTPAFERELPAVEEYQLALKGNNKLLIQDVNGDGEQIFMTFKSQYDEGFTIVHDKDRGQIRIRDHIGNTILLEGDREKPRIILKTSEHQTLEMGGKKGKGQFLYLRNGAAYGDSELDWGRKTGVGIGDVFNQEFIMVDSQAIIGDSEFKNRLSPGLASMIIAPGIYMRTVDDSRKEYEKRYASYEINGTLIEKSIQLWKDTNTSVVTQSSVQKSKHEWFVEGRTNGKVFNVIKFLDDYMMFSRPEEPGDVSSFKMSKAGIELDSKKDINIRSETALSIQAPKVDIVGTTVDVRTGPIAAPKKDNGTWTL